MPDHRSQESIASMLVIKDEMRENAKALVAGAVKLSMADRRARRTGMS